MSDELTQDYIKIILLGESGVGKTNLINVAVGNTFNANSHSSLTSSYFKGSILINKKEFIYILWDTAGQEAYRSLNAFFIKNSKIVIFVFSIESRKSFDELDYWINSSKDELDGNYIRAIVGNKCDLINEQVVQEKEAEEYAKKNDMKIKFTSALSDPTGFKNFLNELIIDYLKKTNPNFKDDTINNNNNKDKNIKLKPGTKGKKKKCC